MRSPMIRRGTGARTDAEIREIVNATSGFAAYSDTLKTSAVPFVVTTTPQTLTNNAGIIYDTQKPTYIPTFYDSVTSKIIGRQNDSFMFTAEFTLRPVGVTPTFVNIGIDIGGAVGVIYEESLDLQKGAGVIHRKRFDPDLYSLDTFEANGGILTVSSDAGTVDLFNLRFVFHNLHRAR